MLSFTSPQDLQNHVDCLPDVPWWSHQTIILPGFQTKDPMTLYWYDSLKVVKYLFANPAFATCMEMIPYKLLDKETGLPVYGEFMSGDFAWEYQVSKPVYIALNTDIS